MRKRKVIDKRLRRGFIGVSRYWPEDKQRELLRQAGFNEDRNYVQSWRRRPLDPAEREEAIKALVPGRVIGVCGLARLATNPRDLEDTLKRIAATGGTILNVLTGIEYTGAQATGAHVDILEALRDYERDRYSPGRDAAKAAGKLGGSPKVAAVVLPESKARPHWFNSKLTAKQALELMIGWKQPTAYRTFGPRFPGQSRGKPLGSKNKRRRRAKATKRKK